LAEFVVWVKLMSLPEGYFKQKRIFDKANDLRTSVLHQFTAISEELQTSELFKPEVTQVLVKFKWDAYAKDLFIRELFWFGCQVILLSAWSICVVESSQFDVSVGSHSYANFTQMAKSHREMTTKNFLTFWETT
jgi:hypothetical protein